MLVEENLKKESMIGETCLTLRSLKKYSLYKFKKN